MTTSNAVVEKKDKAHEKLAEKRRALGRGLESLLPGPRVVAPSPTLAQSAGKDGAPGEGTAPDLAAVGLGGRTNASAATQDVVELQAVAAGHVPDGEHAFELELDQIEQNPYQTRTEFDPRALGDLAASIQVQGVLQPIVVRPAVLSLGPAYLEMPEALRPKTYIPRAAGPAPDIPGPEIKGRYILILGERRYRASKMAGKTTIPAIVKRVSEQQAAEMTLVENLQRQDLECLDQALAFSKLSTEFNLTQEEIGRRVGVSREQVSNYLRLLKLPPEVQVALRNKDLTYSHARLLLALDDESQITKVARVAIAKKMSVALLQELVLDSHMPKPEPAERQGGGARWVDPNVRAAQRSLEAVLGMRVRIRDRKGKGRITIEYGTLEDFDRVVRMLKGK